MRIFKVRQLIQSLLGAVAFYTIIPIPRRWSAEFGRIARWAPLIGLLLGALLGIADIALGRLAIPKLTRSVLIIALWIALTGGLHLDGVIDTADGLALFDRERRLQVMKESTTGAFGVMAAVILLLLKTAALSDLSAWRAVALMSVAGWARWGQVVAIAFFPYLRANGKGAFHKQSLRLPQDMLVGFFLMLGFSGLQLLLAPHQWLQIFGMIISGSVIALAVSFWFAHQLCGHTGDTYGATVEWVEALCLCLFTGF